jgi:hypothetical protein
LPSSRRTADSRRKAFLNLSGQIEGQLREAYDRQFQAGLINQSSLAAKLGVDRSAIHHRLMGHTNMTMETIADMVWGLGQTITVTVCDPSAVRGRNHFIQSQSSVTLKGVPQPDAVTTGKVMSSAANSPPHSVLTSVTS